MDFVKEIELCLVLLRRIGFELTTYLLKAVFTFFFFFFALKYMASHFKIYSLQGYMDLPVCVLSLGVVLLIGLIGLMQLSFAVVL